MAGEEFATPGSLVKNLRVICRRVMAKCHVTGFGQHSIFRLESEDALDAAKLSTTIKRELELPHTLCLFWTDSTIVFQSMRVEC